MDALMADLEAIPNHLHHSEPAMVRKGLADLSTFVLGQPARGGQPRLRVSGAVLGPRVRGRRWRADRGQVGLHEGGGRPGLIVVHGLFSSRRFDYVRQIAVRAYYEWGFNVLALDLRSFGLTNLTSAAPTTVGLEGGRGHHRRGPLSEASSGRPRWERSASRWAASSVLGACHPDGADRGAGRGHRSRSRRPPTRRRWRSASRCGFPAPIRPTC